MCFMSFLTSAGGTGDAASVPFKTESAIVRAAASSVSTMRSMRGLALAAVRLSVFSPLPSSSSS